MKTIAIKAPIKNRIIPIFIFPEPAEQKRPIKIKTTPATTQASIAIIKISHTVVNLLFPMESTRSITQRTPANIITANSMIRCIMK